METSVALVRGLTVRRHELTILYQETRHPKGDQSEDHGLPRRVDCRLKLVVDCRLNLSGEINKVNNAKQRGKTTSVQQARGAGVVLCIGYARGAVEMW